MTTESEFLSRVRDSIGPRHPLGEAPPAGDPLVRLCRHADDAASLFVQRARAAGIFVSLCTTAELPLTLAQTLDAWSPGACALAAHTAQGLDELRRLCTRVPHIDPTVGDALFSPGVVGVTDVFAALAETGSIVLASSPTMPRAVFLVPDRHLAIVRASRLVPDLFDLFTDLRFPPAALTIVSGPSKTADIEGILITGVHGPREVRVILVSDA